MSDKNRKFLFTSESVTEGHPDKIADQISDAVLDAVLTEDPTGRVACETLVTTGLVMVAGEITTTAVLDYTDIARDVIRDVGYTRAKYGFDAETCAVISSIKRQSPDIAMGVDTGGAGDQGLMFGFACDETEELMPLPITLAHKLVQRLSEVRRQGIVDFFRPDGKSQVTVEYQGDRPVRVDTVVISTQHSESVSNVDLQNAVREEVIQQVVPAALMDKNTKFHINPTGRFVVGGPMGDAGLTGRKIIVDTYGGYSRHGGGAFSGKDPTEGGPLGVLHGAVRGEESGGRGSGAQGGSAACLRDRRGRAGFRDGGYVRHRRDSRRADYRSDPQHVQAHAARDHRIARICGGPSTGRRLRSAILGAPGPALPGSGRTRRNRFAARLGSAARKLPLRR